MNPPSGTRAGKGLRGAAGRFGVPGSGDDMNLWWGPAGSSPRRFLPPRLLPGPGRKLIFSPNSNRVDEIYPCEQLGMLSGSFWERATRKVTPWTEEGENVKETSPFLAPSVCRPKRFRKNTRNSTTKKITGETTPELHSDNSNFTDFTNRTWFQSSSQHSPHHLIVSSVVSSVWIHFKIHTELPCCRFWWGALNSFRWFHFSLFSLETLAQVLIFIVSPPSLPFIPETFTTRLLSAFSSSYLLNVPKFWLHFAMNPEPPLLLLPVIFRFVQVVQFLQLLSVFSVSSSNVFLVKSSLVTSRLFL